MPRVRGQKVLTAIPHAREQKVLIARPHARGQKVLTAKRLVSVRSSPRGTTL
jgi:hypothetical protein